MPAQNYPRFARRQASSISLLSPPGNRCRGRLLMYYHRTRASRQEEQRHLALTPCKLPKHQEAARCSKLTVYENRMAKSGRQISLNIVVLPARNSQAAADPVFYLAGGPGQAAARIAGAGEDTIMRELRQERDLVFVDMRGTGESNGLQCDSAVNRNETQSFFREIFDPTVIKACREKLEQIADLKLYNTSLGIDDLDDIRVVLGYDKINLYGISHGSQAALEYLRRYANHARVAALAGVVTSAAKVPLQFATGAKQAITRLFSDCANYEAYNSAFANLETKFAQLLRSFDNGAVTIQALHPTSKAIQMVPLSRGVFTARLLSLLYNHRTLSLLPLIIDRAARRDWRPTRKLSPEPPRRRSSGSTSEPISVPPARSHCPSSTKRNSRTPLPEHSGVTTGHAAIAKHAFIGRTVRLTLSIFNRSTWRHQCSWAISIRRPRLSLAPRRSRRCPTASK